jgi:2-phosphosulfolactate phosphatase
MSSTRQIDVYLLPDLVEPAALAGKTVVVIDVLRATTTIVHALAAGAKEVVPCLEIDEARRIALENGKDTILGGERQGLPIPGFDLGNSPAEYSRDRVSGKTVVFTTTNGTRAMQRCKHASRVLLGAFVNFSAACRELAGVEQIALVCAGTDGHVTREDTLLAGAIVYDLGATGGLPASARTGTGRQAIRGTHALNDQALLAADAWQTAVRLMTDRPLGVMLRESRGGRNLIDTGQENDIDLAAQMDKFDMVPELDLVTWRVRP